jgi:competence protein ComEC
MPNLCVTLIDVGWGDSILIEYKDDHNKPILGLIDSNDTTYLQSSYIFLKKYFERNGIDISSNKPNFEFVILSHAHTDHGQGLKSLMRYFGTKAFYYPKSINWSSLAYLIEYSNRSSNVGHHQSIDDTKILPNFGNVSLNILWPLYNQIDSNNENNNSIVLCLRLGDVTFVLTGDAEEDVWNAIANQIPTTTKVFKIPHHGSKNGSIGAAGNPLWLGNCPPKTEFGISSHVRPFSHPHPSVLSLLNSKSRLKYYRTDIHYHLTFCTDGNKVEVQYSHV